MLFAALLATGIGSPASAKTTSMHVKVLMRVPKTCTVGAPVSFHTDASGRPTLALDSFLSACSMDWVPAVLSVASDAAVKGAHVVTINF
jgi:hypothetical protein